MQKPNACTVMRSKTSNAPGSMHHEEDEKGNRISEIEKLVNLSPFMTESVEIKTGQRRMIKYFLTPILTHTSENFH